MQEKKVVINSSEQMEKFGAYIGSRVKAGVCVELSSDLGGGKTTFTRGFARGMGSFDAVSSPTFTIGKQYKTNKLTCYHFDFYRLQEPGLVAEELREALSDPTSVIIVEWADNVSRVLPNDRLIIKVADNANDRKCTIMYPEKYLELVEDV